MRLLQTGCKRSTALTSYFRTIPRPVRKHNWRRRARAVSQPENYPDFDGFRLDDDYYKEMGMSTEEAAEQLEGAWNVDPEGYTLSDGVAEKIYEDSFRDEAEENEPPFGPPAVVLAGFRDHELGMVRMTLDSVGAHAVKVVPCLGPMLYGTVMEAVESPEPDWEQPKPDSETRSGDWGSNRTVLFSGLTEEDQLIVLDILEEAGLPTLIVGVTSPENKDQMVGEVLAEAVKQQRQWKPQQVDMDGMLASPPDSVAVAPRLWNTNTAQITLPASKPLQASAQSSGRTESSDPVLRQAAGPRDEFAPLTSGHGDKSAAPEPLGNAVETAADNAGAAADELQKEASGDLAGNDNQPNERPQAGLHSGGGRQPHATASAEGDCGAPGKLEVGPLASQRAAPPGARGPKKAMAGGTKRKTFLETWQERQGESPGSASASSQSMRQSFEDTVKGAGKSFMANFEHNTFATEQRELREAAAAEMRRRASNIEPGGGSSTSDGTHPINLIDAVAAGEDLEAVLQAARPVPDEPEPPQPEEAVRQRMEAVLEQMRAAAKELPEEKRERAARGLKAVEGDQEAVGKVLEEMGATLNSVPKDDREILKAKLREEAWQPTKDAIGAALACGISAEELRVFVDQAEKDKAENRLGWYPSVANMERKQELERASASQ